MTPYNNSDSGQCKCIRELLSDYTDSALSARQVWEVEKHLALCPECAREAREMQATVQLLRTAPCFDTSDTFMAALHARLDMLDPALASGPSLWDRMRAWFSSGASRSRARVPALGLGLAMAALAVIFTMNRPQDTALVAKPPVSASLTASDGVHVSVAASANSPFSDPAADNLEYRVGAQDEGPAPF